MRARPAPGWLILRRDRSVVAGPANLVVCLLDLSLARVLGDLQDLWLTVSLRIFVGHVERADVP